MRAGRAALLALGLTLPVPALAHGETLRPELRQVTLCTAPSSVRVVFGDMASPGQRQAQVRLERALQAALGRGLQTAGVRRRPQTSCARSDAGVRLVAQVRYLNPKTYVGFGDPAYSYSLSLTVARPGTAGPRFVASHSDIHSESRTGRSFETEVVRWGAELLDDLATAWRKANPGAPEPSRAR